MFPEHERCGSRCPRFAVTTPQSSHYRPTDRLRVSCPVVALTGEADLCTTVEEARVVSGDHRRFPVRHIPRWPLLIAPSRLRAAGRDGGESLARVPSNLMANIRESAITASPARSRHERWPGHC